MSVNQIIGVFIIFVYYINSKQILRKRKLHNSYLLHNIDKKISNYNLNYSDNIESNNKMKKFTYRTSKGENNNIFSLENTNNGSFILLRSKLKEMESDDDSDDDDDDDDDDEDDDDGKERSNNNNNNNNNYPIPYTALPPPPPPVPPPPPPPQPVTASTLLGNMVTAGLKLVGI
ncbi:asparagine-rich protein, putative [Plasmodium relictum]|uniref:Asparagine-rich protein, putative n=1 Tax=Plasmodium relictum TaxID=85471 RepID=A0A1J1H2S9_PLARL|nr:asparagine-rich protein, putative [Plasmodium relictum]CRG99021.1 asparagine-rich protein, putative [Plasmodium relictum]